MKISRRGLIAGLISFTVAAPAIVRAKSLMPVRALDEIDIEMLINQRLQESYRIMKELIAASVYGKDEDEFSFL